MQTADCRLADYISCYLCEYILLHIPIPIYLYLYEVLVWLTEVLVWLTQARVCKSAVCICRTPTSLPDHLGMELGNNHSLINFFKKLQKNQKQSIIPSLSLNYANKDGSLTHHVFEKGGSGAWTEEPWKKTDQSAFHHPGPVFLC